MTQREAFSPFFKILYISSGLDVLTNSPAEHIVCAGASFISFYVKTIPRHNEYNRKGVDVTGPYHNDVDIWLITHYNITRDTRVSGSHEQPRKVT